MNTPRLNITEINTALSSKHLFSNQGIRDLEAVTSPYFLDFVTSDPVSPSKGDIYVVIAPATGLFTGQENSIALYNGFKWLFYPLIEGLKYYNANLEEYQAFNGSNWNKIIDLPYFLEATTTVNGITCLTYGLNTTTTFNLPEGLSDGDRVTLIDYAGTFNGTPLTINTSGGDTIQDGVQTSLDISLNFASFELIFLNGVWRVFSGTGVIVSSGLPPDIYPVTTPDLDIATLTSNFDVYVDANTGNDSNDGTIGNPFLTVDRAIQELARYHLDVYDFRINTSGNFTFNASSNPLRLRQYRTNGGRANIIQTSGVFNLLNSGGFLGAITIEHNSIWNIVNLNINPSGSASSALIIQIRPNAILNLSGNITINCLSLVNLFWTRGGYLNITGVGTNITFNSCIFNSAFQVSGFGNVIVGDPINLVNINITGNNLGGFDYLISQYKGYIEMNVSYSGLNVNSNRRYKADTLSIIKRNADPSGTTSDPITNKSILA